MMNLGFEFLGMIDSFGNSTIVRRGIGMVRMRFTKHCESDDHCDDGGFDSPFG